MYMPIAFKIAVIVCIIETPILFFELMSYKIALPLGWALVFLYMFFHAWRLHTQYLFIDDDVVIVKLIAGMFLVGLASAALYGVIVALDSPLADDPARLIKIAFISNAIAAIDAVVISTIVAGFLGRAIAWINSRKM